MTNSNNSGYSPNSTKELIHLDNANIIDFLSSCASVLIENNYITERDADNFRLTISGFHSEILSNSEISVLERLFNSSDKLTLVTKELIGESAFYASLLSQGLNTYSESIYHKFSGIGENLVSFSKQFFNRTVYFRSENGPTDVSLASLFSSQKTASLAKELETVKKDCQQILYCAPLTEADMSICEELRKATGSSLIIFTETPLKEFRLQASTAMSKIKHACDKLASDFLTVRTSNTVAADKLSLISQILGAKFDEIIGLYSNLQVSSAGFDLQRNAILCSFCEATEQLSSFDENLSGHIRSMDSSKRDCVLSHKEQDSYLQLLKKDIPSNEALEAVANLKGYLTKNNVELEKLIEQELVKINPALENIELSKVLEAKNEFYLGATKQKTSVLNSLTKLDGSFKSGLEKVLTSTAVFMIFMLFTGCGVKKDPTSITEPIRPDIPYSSFKKPVNLDLETNDKTNITKPPTEN